MEIKNLGNIKDFSPKEFVRKRIFETRNMHFNIYCIEPGQSNALHRHPISDEILFFVEGTGEVLGGISGCEKKAVSAGDVVLWKEAEPHEIINTGNTRMVCILAQAPLPCTHEPVTKE